MLELALLLWLVFTASWGLYVLILSAPFKRLAISAHVIAGVLVILTWLTSLWRAFENLLTKRSPPCCRCPVWASTRAHRLLCGLGTSRCENIYCRFMPTSFTVSSTTLSIWDTDYNTFPGLPFFVIMDHSSIYGARVRPSPEEYKQVSNWLTPGSRTTDASTPPAPSPRTGRGLPLLTQALLSPFLPPMAPLWARRTR